MYYFAVQIFVAYTCSKCEFQENKLPISKEWLGGIIHEAVHKLINYKRRDKQGRHEE